MLRLGLLGFWHVHADDYAREAADHPGVELVAAWDDDADRGSRKAAEHGVPFVPSLSALLARRDIDGVVVTTATRRHRDVIIEAASASKHVFVEKVLAPTAAECMDIVSAVDGGGICLMVSLTHLSHGYAMAVQDLVDRGLLGTLTAVRVRRTHGGAWRGQLPERFFDRRDAAGGALVDLGAHPMYLVRRLLGMPLTVCARFGHVTGRGVEDNAMVVLGYADGALGAIETAFVEDASFTGLEVHGSAGAAVFSSADGRLLVRTRGDEGEPGPWRAEPLPPHGETPFAEWVRHIEGGTRATDNVGLAVDLTRLMEASDRSARSGRAVALSEIEA